MLAVRMQRLPDEELVRIAFSTDSDGFEDDYVAAARYEIERRGLPQDSVQSLISDNEEIKYIEEHKNEEPLGVPGRAAFFLLWPMLFMWIAAGILKHRGYDQKFRDAWHWMLYGFGFYVAIAGIFAFLDVTGL
jgi:hypothetical protein